MGGLGQSEFLHQWRKLHAEPPAVVVAKCVPAADRMSGDRSPSTVSSGDCSRKVWQDGFPPDPVAVPPGARAFAQTFPAPVLDLDPGISWAPGDEPDIDIGGLAAVPAQMPQVRQP